VRKGCASCKLYRGLCELVTSIYRFPDCFHTCLRLVLGQSHNLGVLGCTAEDPPIRRCTVGPSPVSLHLVADAGHGVSTLTWLCDGSMSVLAGVVHALLSLLLLYPRPC
jgi:hypothetical protein